VPVLDLLTVQCFCGTLEQDLDHTDPHFSHCYSTCVFCTQIVIMVVIVQGKRESMYLCLRESVLFPPLMFPTLCGAVTAVPSSVRDGYVCVVDGMRQMLLALLRPW
jgi:hypothetical protein